jgi:DNA-binding transcriptional MocR family regulator
MLERFGFFIIEDGAYAFLAEPAPKPVFTYAPERTVYVCGLSKNVVSGLRLGFVVAPDKLIPELEHAIRISTWNTQSVTVAWLASGLSRVQLMSLRTENVPTQQFASCLHGKYWQERSW